MAIVVVCEHCGASYRVGDALVGKRVRCRQCHEPIPVGAVPAVSPVSSPAATAPALPLPQYLDARPEDYAAVVPMIPAEAMPPAWVPSPPRAWITARQLRLLAVGVAALTGVAVVASLGGWATRALVAALETAEPPPAPPGPSQKLSDDSLAWRELALLLACDAAQRWDYSGEQQATIRVVGIDLHQDALRYAFRGGQGLRDFDWTGYYDRAVEALTEEQHNRLAAAARSAREPPAASDDPVEMLAADPWSALVFGHVCRGLAGGTLDRLDLSDEDRSALHTLGETYLAEEDAARTAAMRLAGYLPVAEEMRLSRAQHEKYERSLPRRSLEVDAQWLATLAELEARHRPTVEALLTPSQWKSLAGPAREAASEELQRLLGEW
jgi:predicted Zn finger-like uncharacterized protein